MSLSSVQSLGLMEVGQVFVICNHCDFMSTALEVVTPLLECLHNGKEFPVIDLVVALSFFQALREEGCGMESTIIVELL